MISMIVLCGAPASGKTTLSKKLVDYYDAVYYSFDEMRCLQHCELIPYIEESLSNGENVVVDSTYPTRTTRTNLIDAIKYIDCKRILIYINTPLEECVRRNSQRSQPLSSNMVEGIYKSMQVPTLDEGWDEIIIY